MGKVATQHELISSYLQLLNKGASANTIGMYADYMVSYSKATHNIREHGDIVQHPRTAAPITNPYLQVRDSAVKMMRTLRLQTGKLTASPLYAVVVAPTPGAAEICVGMPGDTEADARAEASTHFIRGRIVSVTVPS